ncbi:MAG: OmpA family protein [Lentisphaerales bacterium]|nr:OmpA family protein [Lentisphaerales bacterium]
MFKAATACLMIAGSFLFTGCESDPHIYNPDANYGRTGGPTMITPTGQGPLIENEDGWGDPNQLDPSTGGTAIPGFEDQGTPVQHPFTEPVYFAYDSAVVGAAYDDMLKAVAEYLNNNGNYHLTINGHCDERGSEEYNRALSERRALAVKEALTANGALADRVNTVGYGEERPAAPGISLDSYAKNRRAEFEVFSK